MGVGCDEAGVCYAAAHGEPERCPVDDFYDDDDTDCANCGGEGFTYGCSWDWQCDTYDEGEGTCLCTRSCDWCQPRKPDPELQAVLASALAAATGTAKTPTAAECEASQSGPKGNAQRGSE